MRRRVFQKETRQYTCEQCGKTYERTLEVGKGGSRWCSRACRQETERIAREKRGGVHYPLCNSMEPHKWVKFRERIYAKTNGHCQYCGKHLEGNFQIDYVHPRSRGGSNDFDNLVPACGSCNVRKGDLFVDDFLAILAGEEKVRLATEELRELKLAARRRLQESFWFN